MKDGQLNIWPYRMSSSLGLNCNSLLPIGYKIENDPPEENA